MYRGRFEFCKDELLKAYQSLKLSYDFFPYNRYEGIHTLSLQSRTGEFDDRGSLVGTGVDDYELCHFTSACEGYFRNVIDTVSRCYGQVFRARIVESTQGASFSPHTDGDFYRFQIPIIPSLETYYQIRDHFYRMERAGGLYFFPAFEKHGFWTLSGLRVHLLMTIYSPNLDRHEDKMCPPIPYEQLPASLTPSIGKYTL